MCLAVPGQVLSIHEGSPLQSTGRVSFGGIVKEVSLAYVPEARVGDYVIVHVGFAISTLDESEANRTFEYLRQMDELDELEPNDIEADALNADALNADALNAKALQPGGAAP